MLQLRSGVNVTLSSPRVTTQLIIRKHLHGHLCLHVLSSIDGGEATLADLVDEGEVLKCQVWTAGDELFLLLRS